jgi:hypothetical protein
MRTAPAQSADELDRWLRDHCASEPERIVAIYNKASGKQTVTLEELLETALCHGGSSWTGRYGAWPPSCTWRLHG